MKKVFITGAKGMLGSDLVKIFSESGYRVVASDIDDLDLTQTDNVLKRIGKESPDLIIHAAAYTNVDKAETEKKVCFNINENGTINVAQASKENKSELILISTDYVFDGSKGKPYNEDDQPNPQGMYGKSKLAAEKAVMLISPKYKICRTSWLFGENGKNFVETIYKLVSEKDELKVVNDQFGSPTYTKDLAKQLILIAQKGESGIYHATNSGYCSWFDFAQEIVRIIGLKINLLPQTTAQSGRLAPRPKFSVLENKHLKEMGIHIMPDWKDALSRYMKKFC